MASHERPLAEKRVAPVRQDQGRVQHAVDAVLQPRACLDHGRAAGHLRPASHVSASSFTTAIVFDNLKQVVTLLGAERLEAPVVEDEELDAAERARDAGMAPSARQSLNSLWRQRVSDERSKGSLWQKKTLAAEQLVVRFPDPALA